MPEGIFCNRQPVTTEEALKNLLADKGGQQYYKEMEALEVDTALLWNQIRTTCKSRLKTWLTICARCGMCAESCFYYRCNDRDPAQVPAYKIQSTLGEMVRRKGRVDTAFMMRAMDVAWGKCTCCNRCGMYCPHGIDVGVMMSYMRGLLFKQGFVPWEMKIGSGMHRVYKAQMDVTTEEWVETCEWMAEENGEEWPGLEIPFDKEDADVMYTLNAREPKHYPEDVAQAAILFHLTGPCRKRDGSRPPSSCSPGTGKAAPSASPTCITLSNGYGPSSLSGRNAAMPTGEPWSKALTGPGGLTANRPYATSITCSGWPRPCVPAS